MGRPYGPRCYFPVAPPRAPRHGSALVKRRRPQKGSFIKVIGWNGCEYQGEAPLPASKAKVRHSLSKLIRTWATLTQDTRRSEIVWPRFTPGQAIRLSRIRYLRFLQSTKTWNNAVAKIQMLNVAGSALAGAAFGPVLNVDVKMNEPPNPEY